MGGTMNLNINLDPTKQRGSKDEPKLNLDPYKTNGRKDEPKINHYDIIW
jgi:hypothetical protein